MSYVSPFLHCSILRTSMQNEHFRYALRSHLFPCRTQKLSSSSPTILCGRLHGKIGFADLEYAPLAQMVEQLTLNQWVLGSSPRWCTIFGPLVKRLRLRPLTPATGVRFSHGSPKRCLPGQRASTFLYVGH